MKTIYRILRQLGIDILAVTQRHNPKRVEENLSKIGVSSRMIRKIQKHGDGPDKFISPQIVTSILNFEQLVELLQSHEIDNTEYPPLLIQHAMATRFRPEYFEWLKKTFEPEVAIARMILDNEKSGEIQKLIDKLDPSEYNSLQRILLLVKELDSGFETEFLEIDTQKLGPDTDIAKTCLLLWKKVQSELIEKQISGLDTPELKSLLRLLAFIRSLTSHYSNGISVVSEISFVKERLKILNLGKLFNELTEKQPPNVLLCLLLTYLSGFKKLLPLWSKFWEVLRPTSTTKDLLHLIIQDVVTEEIVKVFLDSPKSDSQDNTNLVRILLNISKLIDEKLDSCPYLKLLERFWDTHKTSLNKYDLTYLIRAIDRSSNSFLKTKVSGEAWQLLDPDRKYKGIVEEIIKGIKEITGEK